MSKPLRPVRPFTLATFAALAVLGCAPGDGTGTSSGTSASSSGSSGTSGDASVNTLAGQACLDMAASFATAAQRCGGNYDAERAAFIRDLAGGDCNSVSIRAEAELRRQCLPSFSRITCDALRNQRFDPSCAEQIIRSR
jgi:hypothetical protein